MKTIFITTLCTLFVFTIACKKKATPTTFDCTGVAATYTTEVKPLLDMHCATSGCHNASSKADGKDFSTYSSSKSLAGNNNFLGSIEHLNGYTAMPKGASKLSDTDIKTIACWVQNGMAL